MTAEQAPPWAGLEPHHAALLVASAITPETVARLGIRSVSSPEELPEAFAFYGEAAVPAILFQLPTFGGEPRLQLRPDRPIVDKLGQEAKYVFPAGSHSALMVLRWREDAGRVLIVEGTKQALAAASWAPEDVNVVGMAGCWGWSTEGVPIADLQQLEGRDVVICLDGDSATNLDVYSAGAKLAEAALADGARAAEFLRLPAGKKAGLDDVLAGRDPANREGYLARLLEKPYARPADVKPKPKPAKVTNLSDYRPPEGEQQPEGQPAPVPVGAEFFDRIDGLMAVKLLRAVDELGPTAVDETGQLYRFRDGFWQHGAEREVRGRVWGLLGNRYRPAHFGVVLDGLTAREPLISEERFDPNVFNLPNGLLEWRTGQLYAHSPAHPSTARIPIPWDPEAQCPAVSAWLAEVLGPDGVEFAEEVIGLCLYDGAPVHKAIALFGSGRNGKGTFLRLVTALLGAENVSNITPQRLDEVRFAAAGLYGKLANLAGDVDPKTFQVTEVFKQITGGDRITAERKNQHAFEFTNRATMIASFNRLPKTADTTEGFFSRWLVVPFTGDFRGDKADPAVEVALHAPEELRGLLVRATLGLRRLEARRWVFDPPQSVLDATEEYRLSADPVRLFVESLGRWEPADGWVEGSVVRQMYNTWAAANGHLDQSAETLMNKVQDLGREVQGLAVKRVVRSGKRGLRWSWVEEAAPSCTPPNRRLTGDDAGEGAKDATASNSPHVRVPGGIGQVAPFAPSEEPPETLSTYPLPASVDRSGTITPRTLPEAGQLLAEQITRNGRLTVDVETNGRTLGHRDFAVRTVQLGDLREAVVLDPHAPEQAQLIRLALQLAPKLRAFVANADLIPIAHLGLAEAEQLWAKTHDVVIAAKLSDPAGTGANALGLKPTADRVLGAESVAPEAAKALGALFKANKWRKNVDDQTPIEKNGWAQVDPGSPEMLIYAASDVLDTDAVGERVPWPEPAQLQRERDFQRVCARVSDFGIRLDPDHVKLMHDRYAEGEKATRAAVEEMGITNAGSDPQIAARMAELGARLPLTPGGKLSVAKDALIPLIVEDQGEASELARRVRAFRDFDHQLSAFLIPWQRAVTEGDGRVRPTIYTLGADTGRTSAARPNIQQVPRERDFRPCFIADPGMAIISADFSSVEVRVAAALSADDNLRQMIVEGLDLHAAVAEMVWGEGWTKAQRYTAKRIVFGRLYGGGIPTLARQAEVTHDVAQYAVDMLDRIAPQLKAYDEQLRNGVRRGVTTFPTPTRLIHLDPRQPHKALNYAVQGTARELLVNALELWERTPWGGSVLWPVHDEVVAMVPEAQAEDATAALVACMTTELLGVPILAEAKAPSTRWENAD